MAKAELEAWAQAYGATLESVFVPWSQSRSYVHGTPAFRRNLNWRCSIMRAQKEPLAPVQVYSFDYSAGIAHAPVYKLAHKPKQPKFNTLFWEKAIIQEVETGKTAAHPEH